jgi:putative spermidine/putrescine transport system substrate-binding protein
MEWLYSDRVQLQWLKGYCHPIRFLDLVKNDKVPAELLARLPPAEAYEKALFPSLAQQRKAKEVITSRWEAVVGVAVK